MCREYTLFVELNWLSSQDSLWYSHFLNDSLHVKVSSTTYRRRHEWLQSCYEMTLTELLYLTWPRSPQNPVSIEYSRLDTYLQSACSVCVRYTVGKHHNASVRSCSWCNFATLFWTVSNWLMLSWNSDQSCGSSVPICLDYLLMVYELYLPV